MIDYAKLLNAQGEVEYNGLRIKCKLSLTLSALDVGKEVVIAWPARLEDAVILGVVN